MSSLKPSTWASPAWTAQEIHEPTPHVPGPCRIWMSPPASVALQSPAYVLRSIARKMRVSTAVMDRGAGAGGSGRRMGTRFLASLTGIAGHTDSGTTPLGIAAGSRSPQYDQG